jgi:hypothetical protein
MRYLKLVILVLAYALVSPAFAKPVAPMAARKRAIGA